MWGIWGSYSKPKAIFYLPKGGYRASEPMVATLQPWYAREAMDKTHENKSMSGVYSIQEIL